ANRLFQDFCRREALALCEAPPAPRGPSARWLPELGVDPYWVTEYGRAADLLVIGRPGKGGSLETIEGVLIDSGRPLLIAAASPLAPFPKPSSLAGRSPGKPPERSPRHCPSCRSPNRSLSSPSPR